MGCTGTPVSGADHKLRAVLGAYIHVYDMQQAQKDDATVAIYCHLLRAAPEGWERGLRPVSLIRHFYG